MGVETIIIVLASIVVGGGIGFYIRHAKVVAEEKVYKDKAGEIIAKAKKDANDIRHNAKKDAKHIIRDKQDELEEEFKEKKQNLANLEKGLSRKELKLEQEQEKVEELQGALKAEKDKLELLQKKANDEAARHREEQVKLADKLTHVSGMTKDEAKQELMKTLVEDAKVDAAKEIRKIEEEAQEEAEKRSKRLMGIAIQRFAGEYVAERTISSVDLPDDNIKGRLIGREGRNIRAFEQICGVDLIIDDTPGSVTISSFNVVRKEIAKMTIDRLIQDGRIHPAKIEEFHDKSKVEFEATLRELGERAQMEIGVHGIHPEILKLVGALNYRTSYTQNQYQHALEAAFLCGSMAAELGLNVKQARRAALLHDIGKVLDASAEGSHAVIGADFAKKYGEAPDIVHAIRAHHDDEKPESVLAHIVAASDALSGARPGARKAMMESYISRLTDIEDIVNSFDGVGKSYAISAGREIRVMVENEKIDDTGTVMLSRDIAKKIEEEMSYPGTIKVTVVRETKSVGIAK